MSAHFKEKMDLFPPSPPSDFKAVNCPDCRVH